jgi:hypothetical protein
MAVDTPKQSIVLLLSEENDMNPNSCHVYSFVGASGGEGCSWGPDVPRNFMVRRK